MMNKIQETDRSFLKISLWSGETDGEKRTSKTMFHSSVEIPLLWFFHLAHFETGWNQSSFVWRLWFEPSAVDTLKHSCCHINASYCCTMIPVLFIFVSKHLHVRGKVNPNLFLVLHEPFSFLNISSRGCVKTEVALVYVLFRHKFHCTELHRSSSRLTSAPLQDYNAAYLEGGASLPWRHSYSDTADAAGGCWNVRLTVAPVAD